MDISRAEKEMRVYAPFIDFEGKIESFKLSETNRIYVTVKSEDGEEKYLPIDRVMPWQTKQKQSKKSDN